MILTLGMYLVLYYEYNKSAKNIAHGKYGDLLICCRQGCIMYQEYYDLKCSEVQQISFNFLFLFE